MADTTVTGIDPSQSTLSPNFAPYVYEMLSKGAGAADQPYVPYTGQRYAGAQPLETAAFQGLAGLTTPSAFGTATSLAEQAGTAAGGLSYTPSGLPQYDQVTSGYIAPEAYKAAQFDTGLGPVGTVGSYMSPYMQGVAGIAAREARREADVGRQAEQARLAQAGAFGGSRQAIMEAERQRNLQTQIGDIYTKGLQSAYDRALKQRLDEAGLGLEAQKATEASRQFGATQGMTAAEAAAKFGQSSQLANQQAALEAAKQAELSRQFGAKYGLEGIQQQLEAAKQLGSLGTQQTAAEQGILGLQLKGAEQQRAVAQQPLDFAYEQFKESMAYPYQQASFMSSLLQGLPVKANPYQPGQSATNAGLGSGLTTMAYYDALLGKKP